VTSNHDPILKVNPTENKNEINENCSMMRMYKSQKGNKKKRELITVSDLELLLTIFKNRSLSTTSSSFLT
jgi:hypothetical protein